MKKRLYRKRMNYVPKRRVRREIKAVEMAYEDRLRKVQMMHENAIAYWKNKVKVLEEAEKKVCGTCALFYANGHCHKDPKNPVIMRSGEPACADYHSRSACNNGDCERHKLGAEPCVGCRFCDEKGNI